jgi:hypothetical protein
MDHTHNMSTSLNSLAGDPELTVQIAGQDYHFSELTLGSKSRLQVWLRDNTPDPMESVKASLGGLALEDRQYLLNEASKERLAWPPEISTPKGRIAIMSGDSAQHELLFEGLLNHHPEMTRVGAFRVYRLIEKEKDGLQIIRRIFATLLHLVVPGEEEPAFPKDLKLSTKTNGPSTGSYSIADVSKSSA